MKKNSYKLPQRVGDPLRVLRQYEVEGVKKRKVRLNVGSLGLFVQMEEMGMPSAALLDQMGPGAYDTPRIIAIFAEGGVYLEESDFQFRYVERAMDMPNPLHSKSKDPAAMGRRDIQQLQRRLAAFQGESNMNHLRRAVQRIAAEYPETRQHLVPILRKYATKKACTCPAGIGHNASDYDASEDDDGPMAREWGRAIHRKIINDTPVIGDPTGTRGDPGGAYGEYDRHEKSPPAGADGSPQQKKYNEWYRKNVCPEKDGCGAPWLKG